MKAWLWWCLALSMGCSHGAGPSVEEGDGACLPTPDGSIGGPPRADCPNDLPPTADCPAASPSYKTDIAPIIEHRCTVCHAAGGVEPVHRFGTYAQVMSQKVEMLVFIYGCRMPPSCAEQPTADERQKLLKWFRCGALDN